MNMKRMMWVSAGGALLAAALVISGSNNTVAAQYGKAAAVEIPTFKVDPNWPKPLPNDWVWGPVSGITVDSKDHIWAITRPREVDPKFKGKTVAPAVLEFDTDGNLLQAWGGAGDGEDYEWPKAEHGITVDAAGNVWIAGRGMGDAQLLKFNDGGHFLMQIGHWGKSKGNTDTENLGLPADATPYPKTNEIFVADGYGNRRVIVFDGETGKYKRMWGAFGNVPTDPKPGEPRFTKDEDAKGRGPQQFSTNVHAVRISNDGLVYVCDRQGQRIQVFTIDGKYITQVFVDRGKMPLSTATGTLFGKPRKEIEDALLTAAQSPSRTAFSPDPEQRFLFVLARRHQKIYILDRKTLKYLGSFGDGPGDQPGQFHTMHDMATDSKGNFYTAEIAQNTRLQKFVYTGLKPAPPVTDKTAVTR